MHDDLIGPLGVFSSVDKYEEFLKVRPDHDKIREYVLIVDWHDTSKPARFR